MEKNKSLTRKQIKSYNSSSGLSELLSSRITTFADGSPADILSLPTLPVSLLEKVRVGECNYSDAIIFLKDGSNNVNESTRVKGLFSRRKIR